MLCLAKNLYLAKNPYLAKRNLHPLVNSLQLLGFTLASACLGYFCRQQLRNPRCHGFYRFFVFEAILLLGIQNAPVWHNDIFAPRQLLSSALLFMSLCFVIQGFILLKRRGGQRQRDDTPENFGFENTVCLVTDGIFKYVRHPMYTSLLLLAWGIFIKQITPLGIAAVSACTLLLIIAAKIEEHENCEFFGDQYRDYQKTSKMFIPFLL